MKASASGSAPLTHNMGPITIVMTTRPIVITMTVTRTNIGGTAGIGGIIDTTTTRIPVGTTTGIDEPSANSRDAFLFCPIRDRWGMTGLTEFPDCQGGSAEMRRSRQTFRNASPLQPAHQS